jgi:hypothetical protein
LAGVFMMEAPGDDEVDDPFPGDLLFSAAPCG